MESPEVSTSVKIRQLLEAVHADGVTPSSTSALQRLALVDWMLQLEGARPLNADQSVLLEDLKAAVEAKRREVKATKEDVKSRPIPSSASVVADERTRRVGPTKLLGSYFDQLYPILMKRKVLDKETIYNSCKADPRFSDVICHHFKETCLEDLDYLRSDAAGVSMLGLLDFSGDLEDYVFAELADQFPIPFKVTLDYSSVDTEEIESQRTILLMFGSRIWDCAVNIFSTEVDRTSREMVKMLMDDLSMMPNLHCLTISSEEERWPGSIGTTYLELQVESEWREIADMGLPDLPFLQSLCLFGENDANCEAVKRKLLVKYGRRLQNVVYDRRFAFNAFRTDLPALRKLYLAPDSMIEHEDCDFAENLVPYFSMFLDSPLRVVNLNLDGVGLSDDLFKRAHIPGVLTLLSDYFSGTLEELRLKLSGALDKLNSSSVAVNIYPPPTTSSTWMIGKEFLKLKKFSMRCFPHPDDTGFLLLFPSLEELSLVHAPLPGTDFFNKEQIVELPADVEKLKESNIWQLLPCLEVIRVQGHLKNANDKRGSWVTRKVTRKDCLRRQQEKERLPGQACSSGATLWWDYDEYEQETENDESSRESREESSDSEIDIEHKFNYYDDFEDDYDFLNYDEFDYTRGFMDFEEGEDSDGDIEEQEEEGSDEEMEEDVEEEDTGSEDEAEEGDEESSENETEKEEESDGDDMNEEGESSGTNDEDQASDEEKSD